MQCSLRQYTDPRLSPADVNLTKNPKDLAKDAGNAINKATPDLSEAPGPYDTAREQRDEANVSSPQSLDNPNLISCHMFCAYAGLASTTSWMVQQGWLPCLRPSLFIYIGVSYTLGEYLQVTW